MQNHWHNFKSILNSDFWTKCGSNSHFSELCGNIAEVVHEETKCLLFPLGRRMVVAKRRKSSLELGKIFETDFYSSLRNLEHAVCMWLHIHRCQNLFLLHFGGTKWKPQRKFCSFTEGRFRFMVVSIFRSINFFK